MTPPSNGSRAESKDTEHDELFGPKIALEKSTQMAGFARHDGTVSRRLLDIEERVQSWDWRSEAEKGDRPYADESAPGRGGGSSRRSAGAGKRRTWIFVAAAVVLLAAVGGIVWAATGSSPPAPTRPGQSPAAVQFKSAETFATNAGVQLATGFANLKGIPTLTTVAAFTDPYSTALSSYVTRLDHISWPGKERTLSNALKNQVTEFITFLHSIHTIPGASLGSWIKDLYTHVSSMVSATAQLNGALGIRVSH
jgi:hypothetical protein